jgi:hypothetical protein
VLRDPPPEAPVKQPRAPARKLSAKSPHVTAARVFPIKGSPQPATARRKSANLEQLHQRIEALEQRIQVRLLKQGEGPKKEDLEQLLRRMKMLERRIDTELWTARQREHTLLEMLARPPLKTIVCKRAQQLCDTVPSACWCWLKAFGREWWLDCQPLWWPRFAATWQEALDRARR